MQRAATVAALRELVAAAPRPLGLVPTMGALHAGHMSLVDRARSDCATVVATIYVNAAQFGPNEDFDRYPRPLDRDLGMLAAAGVDAVYTPSDAEMYPEGFATSISVAGPALPFEGLARPGHFDGVATIVAKLLVQASPDRAYFGQKDAQQVAVVKRLTADLGLNVEIVALPTVREPDGLAMSSRNAYLSEAQRQAATVLYRSLSATRDRFRAGARGPDSLKAGCRALIEQEPLVDAIDYLAVVDATSMAPWREEGSCLLIAAVRMGGVRLIDNVVLD